MKWLSLVSIRWGGPEGLQVAIAPALRRALAWIKGWFSG